MLVYEQVWTYKAGSKVQPTGHHQIYLMMAMRLRLVIPSKASRQPLRYGIGGNARGLLATVQSSHRSNGQAIEARQTTGPRMPPETDPWMAMFHLPIWQADIVAQDLKSMAWMIARSDLRQRPTRDAQGIKRSLIGMSLKSKTQGNENSETMLASEGQNANVAKLIAVAMASAQKVSFKDSV